MTRKTWEIENTNEYDIRSTSGNKVVGSSAKSSTGEYSSTVVNRPGNVTGLLPDWASAAEHSDILINMLF